RCVHSDRRREPEDVIIPEDRNNEQREDDGGGRKHALHWKPLLPSRPDGRTISSTISSRNAIVSACSGPNASEPKLSITPSAKPPSMTPGMLPSPPRTQMTNALPRYPDAATGEIGNMPLRSAPAAPAMNAPSANAR